MAQIQRRRGRVQLRLARDEREALTSVVAALQPHTTTMTAATPRAYEDATAQAEYAKWVHPDLAKGRDADIDYVFQSLDAGDDVLVLTDEQTMVWLRGITHLRLAAGELLGITGDDWQATATEEQKDSMEYRMMVTLEWLQEELVTAMES